MFPAQFCELIEQIATADGSAGWVASFGMSLFYLGALPPEHLKRALPRRSDVVFAGGIFPPQKAVLADGGYRVSGRWGFASGSMGASVFGVGILPESGEPLPRMAVLPRESVQIDPVWNTVGTAGTGSHDLVVNDAFVPREWTFVRGGTLNPTGRSTATRCCRWRPRCCRWWPSASPAPPSMKSMPLPIASSR